MVLQDSVSSRIDIIASRVRAIGKIRYSHFPRGINDIKPGSFG